MKRTLLRILPGALAAVLAMGFAISATTDAAAEPNDPRDGGAMRDASAALRDAGALESGGGSVISKTPPDPPPMNERMQWVFDLRWDRGDVYLLEVHKIDMGAPHATPRVMGRFALELFEGPTLIERVRFDFPMLGVPEPPDAGMRTEPRFEPKLKTRIGVLFPATNRGTKLELWDRARDVRVALPWPPHEGPAGPVPDAGGPLKQPL
ncbi:MAG: hypothetical protein JWO86_2448 [Myxococcaceae bacterium]|nr:hypothetical protein [Myxococcaceae bacterium]